MSSKFVAGESARPARPSARAMAAAIDLDEL
jgi:hypothetical protein